MAWAARVLPTRSPVPVLGGLLLEADSGRLRISGLDYEASACIEVEAETVRAGRVLVMGRRLLDVCRVLPESPVVCAVEGSRFSVTGGGARFWLSVLPLDTFIDDAAVRMEVVGQPEEVTPVQQEVQAVIDRAEGKPWPLVGVERYAFYEMAKSAYCVIATGERRFYGCFIFSKGVIPPDDAS